MYVVERRAVARASIEVEDRESIGAVLEYIESATLREMIGGDPRCTRLRDVTFPTGTVAHEGLELEPPIHRG